MCGIFGVLSGNNNNFNGKDYQDLLDSLFVTSQSRGKEAAGVVLITDNEITVYKEPVGGKKFISIQKYLDLFKKPDCKKPFCAIGHTRLATNGLQTINFNNQPVVTENTLGVHNGIIVNDKYLWNKILKGKPRFEVDTEVVFELINYYLNQGYETASSVQKTYVQLEGSATIACAFQKKKEIVLATNTGSLYIVQFKEPETIVFASEKYILKKCVNRNSKLTGKEIDVKQIKADNGLLIDLTKLKIKEFKLTKSSKQATSKKIYLKRAYKLIDFSDQNSRAEKRVVSLYSLTNSVKKIKKHDFDYKKIYALKRCARCILPETAPFIEFNEKGICNYCKNHRTIKYEGESALLKLVEPYRSKDGSADCIIAFSGGRDSSYGLHYLKNELGLNPIAYTYDWGMVTDVARRNESLMVGKLGVEHIIVSADITMKRDHIRKHIRAWMKKPDLGMVPLFMEGDKQCEYYADQTAEKNNIRLVFYCRGNEFENEEFKWGHCGIRQATPKGVIHNLSFKGKLQILSYYAGQYISNPAYINSSIFDTAFAYFSTYIQKHDYVFLWHYIPWEEDKIIKTLVNKYGWETPKETKQTWRTDDGTSAFYNYIYYAVQGYTENDTFRSNQIREGLLSRKKALEIVNRENRPRHEALVWYFDRVGLDGDEVLTVVDKMKKLY